MQIYAHIRIHIHIHVYFGVYIYIYMHVHIRQYIHMYSRSNQQTNTTRMGGILRDDCKLGNTHKQTYTQTRTVIQKGILLF